MRAIGIAMLVASVGVGCHAGPPPPAPLDTAHDSCRTCRMIVSDPHMASQVASYGEEPLFFDDLGCLSAFLKGHQTLPAGAIAYVADHRTGEWVPAAHAIYTRIGATATPMNGGIIAHRDITSRDQDPSARGGTPVEQTAILGDLARGAD